MARIGVAIVAIGCAVTGSWARARRADADTEARRAPAAASTETTAAPAPALASADDEPMIRCRDHTGPVVVTFKADTEIKDLVSWVVGFTCRKFIFDPRIVATGRKVSITVPTQIAPAEAYQIFLAALSSAGLSVVPHGSALRIVESATAKREALPVTQGGALTTPDGGDRFVRYVYRPSYATAEMLHQAFLALKSDPGEVSALGSVLIMTDDASHIREMLAFARLVDVPGGSDGIYTLPVHHADAARLAEKLTAILGPAPGAAAAAPQRPAEPGKAEAANPEIAATPTKIIVDERTNTLIIAARETGYRRVAALVERLDVALETDDGSTIHVYPLGGAIAEELAKTLSAAIGDGRSSRQPSAAATAPAVPGSAQRQPSPPASQPSDALSGLGAALEGQVRVIADPPTNALIVMSSARDFLAIKDVIRQLDLPRRQVYIEATILDVDVTNNTALGASSHFGSQSSGDGSTVFGGVKSGDLSTLDLAGSLKNASGLFAGITGSTISLLGQSIPSFSVLINAMAAQSNTRVVSSPSIVAVDNIAAKYKVGLSIPVQHTTLTLASTTGGTGNSTATTDQEELPLTLEIKPHISNDDTVLLEVKHENKELISQDSNLNSTWGVRSFETRVVVRDQETIVLSGLTQDRQVSNVTKVPLLGDIPLLGYLFKTTTSKVQRSSLVILLTPYLLRSPRDLQIIRERKLREYNEFSRSMDSLSHMTYEPYIDYGKKRGLIEEINRSVQDVERDAAARAALPTARGVAPGVVDLGPPPGSAASAAPATPAP